MATTTEKRIYINSYMMKTRGDDTEFEIDLGAQYTFNRLQLDSCIIENQFTNFYDSYKEDFRLMKVYLVGRQETYTVVIDQFVANPAQLIDLFNRTNTSGGLLTIEANQIPEQYKNVLSFRFRYNGNIINTRLVGGGVWSKLGFEMDDINNQTLSRQIHTSTKAYDFSQSPVINIGFENIPNAFKSQYGQHSFSIPVTSTYGSRIFYTSTVEKTAQHLHFVFPQTIDRLSFRLTNCDLKKLITAKQNSVTADNNNGIECIFVFTASLD